MPPLFFGFLVGLIGSLFISVGTTIIDIIRAVMPIVQQVFNVIKLVVSNIGTNAGRFFRFISTAARSLFTHVLKPLVDSVRIYYERFRSFLRRVFDPVIRIFDAVQRVMTKIWDKVVAPILDAIDKVRQALRLLAAIGVPFVKKLEEILQRIQETIFDRFRQVQSWINTASFWLDILLDPRGWIKSTPFLYTVYRYAGNVFNIITKLADDDGLHQEKLDQAFIQTTRPGVELAAERFRDGTLKESGQVQSAAARFRSRQSGRVA